MTFISTLLKAAAALFMLVILMLLVQLDLTDFQTVEVLAPGWGWLAFVSLLALETGAVLWLGLAWFSRAPRRVLRDDPTEADRQAFARELERRLKKNPHVRAAGLRATDEHFLEKALDVLDARAGEEIRNSAKRVLLGTALSQNGRLDALIVRLILKIRRDRNVRARDLVPGKVRCQLDCRHRRVRLPQTRELRELSGQLFGCVFLPQGLHVQVSLAF